jgi:hypothetical protein
MDVATTDPDREPVDLGALSAFMQLADELQLLVVA